MKYKKELDYICQRIYEGDFMSAEDIALTLIEKIHEIYEKDKKTSHEEVIVTKTLIRRFNQYYKAWVRDKQGDDKILMHIDKDNLLLDNASDVDSFYDMLWNLQQHITSNPKDYALEDVKYSLSCYKKTNLNLVPSNRVIN